ncbi:tRNA (adenosine(37)-N6)-threonylcarbamoyltransferase complex ATPase subunit type 1 TsaE [Patescibacteria group bacterium]|nr:tRNA (adenosine(37)-N6)-threonylcarbamoyltransferase complex ATPase subunit type 1 TsaE [Patescibacteria group bacterium]
MAIYKIKSLDDLQKFAKNLCSKLKAGQIIALTGELGAGKTTLVQMIAKELGIKARVASPTFNLVKEYDVKPEVRGIKKLCHIDLYRIDGKFDDLGLDEYFDDKDSVLFIEWAEKIKKHLPKDVIWIKIDIKKDGTRAIENKIILWLLALAEAGALPFLFLFLRQQ